MIHTASTNTSTNIWTYQRARGKKRTRLEACCILIYWSLTDLDTHFTLFLPQPPTTTSTPEPSKAPTKVRQDQYWTIIYFNNYFSVHCEWIGWHSLPHVTCIGIPLLGARYPNPYYGRASSFHTINGWGEYITNVPKYMSRRDSCF